MKNLDRRSFLRIAGMSIGVGALYQIAPIAGAEAQETMKSLGARTGETVTPFSFVQLSDTHVGFHGPPDPLGTKAFETAVEMVNRLSNPPELVIFTGDLTHDTDDKDEHARRMAQFKSIAGRLKAGKVRQVPGEHDAALDGGVLFRENFGETHYSFDHRGVHFVALDNVSRARPEVGPEQLAWLKADIARFSTATPIVIFTHRPLFDLKPEWEWFTSDGDDVMNALAQYENVTVLYGHIHRQNVQHSGKTTHYAARSLIFSFPDPATVPAKKPIPFDKAQPFKNLGMRIVSEQGRDEKNALAVKDVELTMREFSGTAGIQQMLKEVAIR